MRISVVIATKDRQAYLERTLASLQGQLAAPSFEIVVVDNGSTDESKSVAERYRGGTVPLSYVFEPNPNRGKARNRGAERARGEYLLFCDDDVALPTGWIAAHAGAHERGCERVVNGPILNVPSYESRPKPSLANYSGAFLCTCNASLSRRAFDAVGGFDETFDLYGWEDTELGVRLRQSGLRRGFAWDAYLWHIKPPGDDALGSEIAKAIEKARMARRFVAKHPSPRARLATGAHPLNILRARYLLPERLIALYAGVVAGGRAPAWLEALARAQLLDGVYTRELVRELDAARDG
ncbi:MAG: glycosyltransferase [Candidatus Baltobacteraceae bacterium]